MSQVLLGFRNLAFRAAIFVVLAAILVWMLGGNLFARNAVIPIGAATTGPGDGVVHVRLEQVIPPAASLPSDAYFFRIAGAVDITFKLLDFGSYVSFVGF